MNARQSLLILTIAVVLAPKTDAADYTIQAGSTGRSIYVQLMDSPSSAKYVRAQGTLNSFLSTELTNADSAWSSGKWKIVDGNGWGALVRIDVPDAALVAGVPSVSIMVAEAGGEHRHVTIDLVGYDPTATALPANVTQFGGMAGSFSGGRPEVLAGTEIHRGAVVNEDSSTELILDVHSFDGAFTGCLIVLHDSATDANAVRRITNQTIDGGGRAKVTLDSAPPFSAAEGTKYEVVAARAMAADLTPQDVADAMKLAPGAGTPAGGSVQSRLQGTLAANVTQFGGTSGTFNGGRPEVNTTHIGGTAQTARDIGASVLLSSGTGTGQLLLSSGNIAGSVGSINGITFPTNFSGLMITSGRVNADVTHWLGTAAATPTVGGVPEVDITHVLGTEVCH